MRRIGVWLFRWLRWFCLFIAVGATLGAFLFSLLGFFFSTGIDPIISFGNGAFNGAFYFMIWGVGLAAILTFVEGWTLQHSPL